MNGSVFSVVLTVLLCTTGGLSRSVSGPCNGGKKGLIGAYTPQCTPSGFYQVVQHHGSTGNSWCAHPESGTQVGAKKGPTEGEATCGKCLYALSDFLNAGKVLGRTKPSCDANGNFQTLQTSGSTGHSWCVDSVTGTELSGTRVGPGKQANCNVIHTRGGFLGPCSSGGSSGLIGAYTPQCTSSGFFQVVQRHASTGFAWCVNPESGAKAADGQQSRDEPTCGKCYLALAEFLSAAPAIGRQKPSCDENGKYSRIQSSGSTGFSWCVNPETGEKIQGSEKGPSEPSIGRNNCEAPAPAAGNSFIVIPPCIAAKRDKPQLIGGFVPQCDTNGFFSSVQSHEGNRWCVDTSSGEKLPGSPTFTPGQEGKLPCEN